MDAAAIAKTSGQALTQQEWLKEIALHFALLEENVKTVSAYLVMPALHIDASQLDHAELERLSQQFPGRIMQSMTDKAKPKPTLPVGVSVLLTNENGEVCLGERINNTAEGLLSTPGGRVELNEDIIACAIRETAEETSIRLCRSDLDIVDWREHFRYGNHYIMFYLHAKIGSRRVVNTEPGKCKGWAWYLIDDVEAGKTTEPLEILDKVKSRLRLR